MTRPLLTETTELTVVCRGDNFTVEWFHAGSEYFIWKYPDNWSGTIHRGRSNERRASTLSLDKHPEVSTALARLTDADFRAARKRAEHVEKDRGETRRAAEPPHSGGRRDAVTKPDTVIKPASDGKTTRSILVGASAHVLWNEAIEAAALMAEPVWLDCAGGDIRDADREQDLCAEIAARIRALKFDIKSVEDAGTPSPNLNEQ